VCVPDIPFTWAVAVLQALGAEDPQILTLYPHPVVYEKLLGGFLVIFLP